MLCAVGTSIGIGEEAHPAIDSRPAKANANFVPVDLSVLASGFNGAAHFWPESESPDALDDDLLMLRFDSSGKGCESSDPSNQRREGT